MEAPAQSGCRSWGPGTAATERPAQGQFQISVVPRAVRLAWFSWPGSRAVVGRVAAVGLGVHAPRGGFRARGWRCRKSTHLGTHTIKLGLEPQFVNKVGVYGSIRAERVPQLRSRDRGHRATRTEQQPRCAATERRPQSAAAARCRRMLPGFGAAEWGPQFSARASAPQNGACGSGSKVRRQSPAMGSGDKVRRCGSTMGLGDKVRR